MACGRRANNPVRCEGCAEPTLPADLSDAADLFTASMGQLRWAPSGALLGLDYTAVEATARMMGLHDPAGDLWHAVQQMEAAMLEARTDRLHASGQVH